MGQVLRGKSELSFGHNFEILLDTRVELLNKNETNCSGNEVAPVWTGGVH